MKVYINRRPVLGPWGGGNKFVKMLSDNLLLQGHDVVFRLEKGIDKIFCFDPRPNRERIWYQDLLNYKAENGTKIIQRVGDIGTHSKPELTALAKESLKYSDFAIFPSRWARDTIGYVGKNSEIIENAPHDIFYTNKKTESNKNLKIVTHHWSMNIKKGFDFYKYVGDQLLIDENNKTKFTYIGRYNGDFESKGIKLKGPMNEEELSEELILHDVYLTASLEEAGANHVLEAMACGLPIVYRSGGGSINEYCKGRGVEYKSKEEIFPAIEEARRLKFDLYERKMSSVIERYCEIINTI